MPGSSLSRLDHCQVWVGPPTLPNLTVVRKVRLGDKSPSDLIERVRETVTALGRRSARWWITPLSTPANIFEVLASHSLAVDDEVITAMATRCSSIVPAGSRVKVRRAESVDDYVTAVKVAAVAFGAEAPPNDAVAAVFEGERDEEGVAVYLAEIDDRPVATARATFSPEGVALNGGATLPEARGRGAYRALVSARCRDAEARNIEWVVVQARPSAAPILKWLGFKELGEIRTLVDTW
jgi:predicted GNAT family acetyltransferase